MELEYCPFCKNNKAPEVMLTADAINAYRYHGISWVVCCNSLKGGCGAMSGSRPTKEDAIAVWNTRSDK